MSTLPEWVETYRTLTTPLDPFINLKGYGWMLWVGLGMTVKVGLASLLLAIALGILGASAKLSRNRFIRGIADTYTIVIRGVPELVLLLIIFYGTPTLIQSLLAMFGHKEVIIDFNAFITGVCTLGFIYGAFATEVFRGAFLAVPPGQIEAARAMGMSRTLAFRRITLPQVWRFALPGLGNVWLVLLKATALISVIQLDELMRKSFIAMGTTKTPFTVFFVAAMMYLALTVLSNTAQRYLEHWANRGVRRA